MVDGAILQIMLEYLYTGKCLFPRDDLSKALEVIHTAWLQYCDVKEFLCMNKTTVASHSRNVPPKIDECPV